MSTVTAQCRVFETSGRNRREVFAASAAIEDVSRLANNRVRLLKGESLTVDISKLFTCSVNIPILIQIDKDGTTCSFPLNSVYSISTDAKITITNPENNTNELPAIVTFVSI